ncbi:MAG: peptidase [Bacteroidetes bacterium]|nr:MAG: peptidase [Bacteroidota bacterium]
MRLPLSVPIGFLLFLALPLAAQIDLPVSREIQEAYAKGTRNVNGSPGVDYWQNTAQYDIRVRLVPESRHLSGNADIVYSNNSPDTLRMLVFKLYPNYYQKGATRLRPVRSDDLTDGVEIRRLVVNNEPVEESGRRISGTNMMVRINPLPPGQTATINLSFAYTLNKGSHNRTGQVDEGAWFVAYFFPRIAVYDDINGWNLAPYLGSYEFYHDFCDFNLAVTVPEGYVVWATGDLQNCGEVLQDSYCQRLELAEKEETLRFIIDSSDLKNGGITRNSPDNTFRFAARNVPDVAFAASNHYVWESGSLVVDPGTGRRTRVDAVFNPEHQDYYLVAGDAWKTVEAMSYRFPKWPFPYAHMTVFDGLDQMEYPMMANDNPMSDRAESIELTDHEIFHTMFPFYMGINETKYGWMDEGWATIGEWLISPMIDSTIVDDYGMQGYEQMAGREEDLPVMSLTTQQSGWSGFTNSYPKPALGYLYVKDMLGDTRFFKALHHYIQNWNGKHPMPYDFFYSMNAGAGENLNWFWKRWFFDSGVPDLAIEKVTQRGSRKEVVIVSKGTKPVPVDLTITYSDGSTEAIHRSIAVWASGATRHTIRFRTQKQIKSISLGSTYVPDVERSDNFFQADNSLK